MLVDANRNGADVKFISRAGVVVDTYRVAASGQ